MSVFTALSTEEIATFVSHFDIGELIMVNGVPGGSENTNYFVDCTGGRFVLTLVERGPVAELPFFVTLLECLQRAGLPVPYAIVDRNGSALHNIKNRPALLQPRLPGDHVEHPQKWHCEAIGHLLARLHDASCSLHRSSDRGPTWVVEHAWKLLDSAWQDDQRWLAPALTQLTDWLNTPVELPSSIIHGDLFRDNVLFDSGHISGVIDFYNAATGWDLLDLAICVNDWCVDVTPDGVLMDRNRIHLLLSAYGTQRALTPLETACWPLMLQLAALRFWVSRQQYAMSHNKQPDVLIKDPTYFRQIMRLHVQDQGMDL
jgi:homoserine kinase type II